jgi:hypothetical protein
VSLTDQLAAICSSTRRRNSEYCNVLLLSWLASF